MSVTRQRVSEDRIARLITHLSYFNLTPGEGTSRPTFSSAYLKASAYLAKIMSHLGLDVRVTMHGNMIARWGGREDRAGVLVGSHIDSVPHGGNYDGVAGVVAAIEAVQSLKESGFVPLRPVYIVVFAEEEGSSFGHLLAGSQAWVGELDSESLEKLTNKKNISYLECARQYQGLYTPATNDILTRDLAVAMIELHIEQSVVLERRGVSVGIVTGIAGARQFQFQVRGQTNHGGATPMSYRYDALAGVAEAITRVERMVKEHPSSSAVVTCGTISCLPGVPNVIPGEATFSFDIRDVTLDSLEKLVTAIMGEIEQVMADRNLCVSSKKLSSTPPISLDQGIVSLLAEIAQQNNVATIQMSSGAVHDAATIAQVIPTGMIFVPSVDGRSHCPEEFTNIEDIAIGCNILADAIRNLASK